MANRGISSKRTIIVAVFLIATAGLLRARGTVEVRPHFTDLDSLPLNIAGWTGKTIPLSSDVLATLGDGHFLQRMYYSETAGPIDLFIAYYPSQRTGDTIHSPKNCLPGAGWYPVEAERTRIDVAPQVRLNVNRYLIARGGDRELVLYWYQAHGRTTPSEYTAKFRLIADSIRMNRSDGGMVRVISPVMPEESVDQTQKRLVTFIRQLYPNLGAYIPK